MLILLWALDQIGRCYKIDAVCLAAILTIARVRMKYRGVSMMCTFDKQSLRPGVAVNSNEAKMKTQ